MDAAMTTRASRIETTLRQHFQVVSLVVRDDSHLHAGHAGASPAGETHYAVLLVAPEFDGQSRVARSRLVHELLADEFSRGLHALSLTLRTPQEHALTAN
jgi:BolA protein